MPYVFRQSDLPKLDIQVDRGGDFEAWRAQWTSYCTLSGLAGESAATKVQVLTLCLSRETLSIVNNLGLSEEQRSDSAAIIQAIKRHIDGQINESVERRNLRSRRQQPGESFDDFLVALRELTKTCNFCSNPCAQKSIRDQIIEGLIDQDTVEHLLRQQELTLEAAITICRAQEAAKKQCRSIQEGTPASVLAIQQHKQQPLPIQRKQPLQRPQPPQQRQQQCPGCGSKPHLGGRTHCPAYDKTCHHCSKIGHFAKVCRARQSRTPGTTQPPAYPSANVMYIPPEDATITEQSPNHLSALRQVTGTDHAPTISIQVSTVNGSAVTSMLPDTGADISAAGPHLLTLLDEHPSNLLPSLISPLTASGHKMTPMGKLPTTFSLQGRTHREEIHVFKDVTGVMMSWKACKALGILPPCYPTPLPVAPAAINAKEQANPPTVTINAAILQPPLSSTDQLTTAFPTVFDGHIRVMQGEEFHIAITDSAKPFCVHTPRTIPFAYREKLQAELQLLESQHIITPVTEATAWCAPIVVTPKKNSDKIRMCVDLSHLNRFVIRERYQSPTPAEAVADIAASEAKIFTVLDALKGYHQCPLNETSQPLTTSITPFGRYKYLRAPYGLSSISEHYNRRMTEAFRGLSGFRRIVDDFVIYDSNISEHEKHVRQFLQRCADCNITLNTDKCQFFKRQVTFAGFQLSAEGYQVDPSITLAITAYPSPTNRSELRSFLGLVNQLSTSTNTLATLLGPLRPLLSTKNEFMWSATQDEALSQIKKSLTTAPVLSFFDIHKPTRLCTDASRQGLGFILQQKTAERWVLVQAGSRFLSEAEARYAVIELEMLAVAWAIMKCRIFLAGLPHFNIITNHNPLISILNTHRLDEIENPRLQRLKTRIMGYNFTAEWTKGSGHHAPDALSRHPTMDPCEEDTMAETDSQLCPEITISEIRAVSCLGFTLPTRLQDLRDKAEQDVEYQDLYSTILNGFPAHRRQLPETCKQFWAVKGHLSIEDGLIVHGCQLLVPRAMRRQVLADLHEAHQGIVRTKQRARLTVYWPGINNDIENIITACQFCQDHLPSNPKEPIVSKPKPLRPFQEVAADFAAYGGKQFLIIVDCYSDWPDVIPMGSNTTTRHLVSALRSTFCRTAIPDILWSDGGPQFTAKEFNTFAAQWGFTHKMSSPRYPQSNGKAEATVKSMKRVLAASWDHRQLNDNRLCRALLQYRNTPSRRDGLSPAQKLYGHPVQDSLPAHRRSFAPEWQRSSQEADQQAAHTLRQSETYYNTHTHPLTDIEIGSAVALQNTQTKLWDTYATVVAIGPHRRYHVRTQSGRVLVRNRRFLRHRTPASCAAYTPQQIIPSNLPQDSHTPSHEPSQSAQQQRRSQRSRRAPARLIEDPTWP